MNLSFQSGFRNHFSTEALPNALPHGQNSPQRCPYDLYAEQLSGTAFTAPRSHNLRSWLYRIRPSVVQSAFEPISVPHVVSAPFQSSPVNPTPMRWGALPMPSEPTDFIDGLFTVCGNGDARTQSGVAIAQYAFNRSMVGRFFYNADAEMMIVPQMGALMIRTEFGVLQVAPKSIAVIPRGVKFQVILVDGVTQARGYVCENHGAPFELPSLGPIGANGLANPRDFLTPVAAFEDETGVFELVAKFDGAFWRASLSHSPLDVVAWHGNYAPYQYDLTLFNAINTVSFDHCDPSIFTVLTSPSAVAGTANVDFVIFPPRWMVAEHTFRPPWFHRNVMSEFMGLIEGVYDAKAEGFVPGGAILHNCMSPHGPDALTFDKASTAELKPEYLDNTLAFMFETQWLLQPTTQALSAQTFEKNYMNVWQGLDKKFLGAHDDVE
jgi:homogentisate 1,2-dioxygenase